MITSKYVEGKARPYFDDEVSSALEYPLHGGGNDMNIGVENFNGEIYRIVNTTGMGAYIHATSGLLKIGLKDLLADSLHGEGGFDSRFIPTEKIRKKVPDVTSQTTDAASELLSLAESIKDIPETERIALVKSRLGQGIFRERVVSHWKACSVTGSTCIALLRASHIKPWRDCSNLERLDPQNGLLLAPNLDSAFDAGYITFDVNGKILFSRLFDSAAAYALHISAKLKINTHLLTAKHREYLAYHRDRVYVG